MSPQKFGKFGNFGAFDPLGTAAGRLRNASPAAANPAMRESAFARGRKEPLFVTASSFWDQLKAALGLDEPAAVQTLARVIQVLLVALATILTARWASRRVDRAARVNRMYADAGSLASRGAGFLVYALGFAAIFGLLGASWTATIAVLGAATFAISLAFQDVLRNFVNGLYILIERPFRLGDRVRIGIAEGRVEDIGVRLTVLRTDGGDRIVVPNTVVFSSIVENASAGEFDRQHFSVTGIALPIAEIVPAVNEALASAPHRSPGHVVVSVVAANPVGASIELSVEFARGCQITDAVIERLHARFPEAAATTKSALSAARPSAESPA